MDAIGPIQTNILDYADNLGFLRRCPPDAVWAIQLLTSASLRRLFLGRNHGGAKQLAEVLPGCFATGPASRVLALARY
jgi:hypothetical protein